MKDEFIIINRTALEKRKEEIIVEQKTTIKKLKELYDSLKGSNKYFDYKDNLSRYFTVLTNEKRFIEKTLSQSTPLIPEIENGIYAGYKFARQNFYNADNTLQPKVQEYISNLKLDI